jgi:hypothetical protein
MVSQLLRGGAASAAQTRSLISNGTSEFGTKQTCRDVCCGSVIGGQADMMLTPVFVRSDPYRASEPRDICGNHRLAIQF